MSKALHYIYQDERQNKIDMCKFRYLFMLVNSIYPIFIIWSYFSHVWQIFALPAIVVRILYPKCNNNIFLHLYAPSRYHSRSRYLGGLVGQNPAITTGCHNQQKNSGKRKMYQNITQAMGKYKMSSLMPTHVSLQVWVFFRLKNKNGPKHKTDNSSIVWPGPLKWGAGWGYLPLWECSCPPH